MPHRTICLPPPGSTGAAAWDDYVAALLESEFEADPPTAVRAGRHEFDGRLPDWSRAGIDNEIHRLRVQRERALARNRIASAQSDGSMG